MSHYILFLLLTIVAPCSDRFMHYTVAKQRQSGGHFSLSLMSPTGHKDTLSFVSLLSSPSLPLLFLPCVTRTTNY